MGMSIFALTKEGSKGAFKLALALTKAKSNEIEAVELYIPTKFSQQISGANDKLKIIYFQSTDFSKIVRELWSRKKSLIFIMALGIVVRTIAPLLKHKAKDPAVVVLDEKGQFAISVLSGHLGGANELCQRLAGLIGATPVITTASDVQGKPAFDLLAKKYRLSIESFEALKRANSALVNGEKIYIFLDKDIGQIFEGEAFPPEVKVSRISFSEEGFKEGFKEEILKRVGFTIFVTNKEMENLLTDTLKEQSLILRPRNLYVGIGCRKGVEPEVLKKVVTDTLNNKSLSPKAIQSFGTVDIKKEEKAILELAKRWDIPLRIYDRNSIKAFTQESSVVGEGTFNFSYSAFVEEKIGVGGVCEPVALMMKEKTKLIQRKKAQEGVTVAIAEASFGWWE